MSDLELLDIPTVARILSISPFTLRRHISVGNISATRVGRRVLLRREWVEEIKANGLPSLRHQKPDEKPSGRFYGRR